MKNCNKCSTLKDSDPAVIKVWVISLGKQNTPSQDAAESRGEQGIGCKRRKNYDYELKTHKQLETQELKKLCFFFLPTFIDLNK